jgi:hypothetical protein
MIVLAAAIILKIKKRSNNGFAYVLLSFTVLLGAAYIGQALLEFFTTRKDLFPNYYVKSLFLFLIPLTALQGWIFAIRYWQSATLVSINKSWFTFSRI